MKFKLIIALIILAFLSQGNIGYAQEESAAAIEEIKGQLEGFDENIKTLQTDVSGLKKIKLSGYAQFEWLNTEEEKKGFGFSPYDSTDILQSQFRIRRARVKMTYKNSLGSLVAQGDFNTSGFTLKDFYFDINNPWASWGSLKLGMFNRPNYEIEYSSTTRESMERSSVVKALYPNERDLGAMLTINPDDMFNLQFAAFMNTYQSAMKQSIPNFSEAPMYYMARITKSINLTKQGLGIDFGAHARFGNTASNSIYVIESDAIKIDSTNTIAKGDGVARNWFGGEVQIYWDFLGGMKLMGEYIMGSDVNEPKMVAKSKMAPALRKRDFSGYYVMLVKNLPLDFQVAVKYDSYDPNTAIDDALISSTSELTKTTLGLGIHNYTFSNVRISLWYDMITTQTHDKLMTEDPDDNLFTVRLQYKF